MNKKILKYLGIFIGVGAIVGGLTTAFVISAKRNSQDFIEIQFAEKHHLEAIWDEEKTKTSPQFAINITDDNENFDKENSIFTFELTNMDDLVNLKVTGDSFLNVDSTYADGKIAIKLTGDEKGNFPKKGEAKEGDPLEAYKGLPKLVLIADNVKYSFNIYFNITF